MEQNQELVQSPEGEKIMQIKTISTEMTEKEFDKLIAEGVVVIDFFATWCGPCKQMAPVLEEVAQQKESVRIIKVDVDAAPEIAAAYNVMSIPTLIKTIGGDAVTKVNGFVPAEALIDQLGL